MEALVTILGAALSAAATHAPAIYRAIVPDGRSPEQVIADARAAVAAIPVAPAATSIDAAIASRMAAPAAIDAPAPLSVSAVEIVAQIRALPILQQMAVMTALTSGPTDEPGT